MELDARVSVANRLAQSVLARLHIELHLQSLDMRMNGSGSEHPYACEADDRNSHGAQPLIARRIRIVKLMTLTQKMSTTSISIRAPMKWPKHRCRSSHPPGLKWLSGICLIS